MKTSFFTFYILLLAQGFSAQGFEISKDALTFPDGDILSNPVNYSPPTPTSGKVSLIFVEYSDQIEGNVLIPGYEGHGEAFSFDSKLFQETDTGGRPVGDIEKSPIIITKPIDAASADLLDRMSTTLEISELKIKALTLNPQDGNFEEVSRITLTDAKVVGHRYKIEYNEDGSFSFVEKLTLLYTSIKFNNYIDPGSTTIN